MVVPGAHCGGHEWTRQKEEVDQGAIDMKRGTDDHMIWYQVISHQVPKASGHIIYGNTRTHASIPTPTHGTFAKGITSIHSRPAGGLVRANFEKGWAGSQIQITFTSAEDEEGEFSSVPKSVVLRRGSVTGLASSAFKSRPPTGHQEQVIKRRSPSFELRRGSAQGSGQARPLLDTIMAVLAPPTPPENPPPPPPPPDDE